MARKTKEDALVTRSNILNAAEQLFQAQGVSGTSLHHIAQAAGVTRGAVYWHFKGKAEVFNAMMERVCLPMEEAAGQPSSRATTPLAVLDGHLTRLLQRVAADERLQRVFDIATHKVEYVNEMCAVRERCLSGRRHYTDMLEACLRQAQTNGDVRRSPSARDMAIGLHALVDGLVQNWMLDRNAFDLLRVGKQAVRAHLAGLAPPA